MPSPPIQNVKINDPFWSKIQNLVIDVVLPFQQDILEDIAPVKTKSHAVRNFRIAAGEEQGEFHGMVFQDSDIGKWLEAVAYALSVRPNPALEQKADELIALLGRAQEEDGYLNTYFQIKEPENKWKNLQECHELYCSGHLIEAAVAYYESTGKDAFLKIMRKNADLICKRFGKGKTRGVPGHQEIELALKRLYDVTGEKSYLETAQYFIDERGTEPDFFTEEAAKINWRHFGMKPENKEYAQNHQPVRQQKTAVGHSVRAVYMYTGMAALANETGDAELLTACRTLWENTVHKQMYITGGIGSTVHGEAFTVDYDLPNDTVYGETCASIAMVFFARHMLQIETKGEYADIMEKMLYNGVLSGMRLDGKRFFYVNPLEVIPGVSGVVPGHKHVLPERPEWYTCACCPPNVSRLFTSLGQYAWSEKGKDIFSHLYMGGSAEFSNGTRVNNESGYPWDGNVKYTIIPGTPGEEFTFAVRIPAWCKEWSLNTEYKLKDGYAYITKKWNTNDTIELKLDIKPRRVYANTKVRANAGNTALMFGPLVYCLEEIDNGGNLSALRLPRSAKISATKENVDSIGEITILEADGQRMESNEALYSDTPPETKPAKLRAVPYYAWGNRGAGGMRVWVMEG